MGHCIASYGLTAAVEQAQEEEEDEEEVPDKDSYRRLYMSAPECREAQSLLKERGWKHVLTTAIASTRQTYPDVPIACLLDGKLATTLLPGSATVTAFAEITEFLDELRPQRIHWFDKPKALLQQFPKAAR